MSFVKTPSSVNRHLMTDARVPVVYRVYAYLQLHCDYETGELHRLSASEVAEEVICSRRSVIRAVHEIRERQWLLGGETLLSGCLVGFRSRPYKTSKPRRRPKSPPPVQIPDIPFSGNGTGDSNGTGTKTAGDVLEFSPRVIAMVNNPKTEEESR